MLLSFVIIDVEYLFAGAKINAQTGTGDTALTYACENGHTDVADIILQFGGELVSFEQNSLSERNYS